jgi:hypothetical protein
MTPPKEKAKELVDRFHSINNLNNYEVKQCALIAVNEIINCDSFFKTLEDSKAFVNYWNEVQQEIQKL